MDELAAECGVARATVRQAVGLLEAGGLVERFRAKGTFVRRRPQEQLWCDVEADWQSLLSSRDGAKIEILSEQPGRPLVHHPIGSLATHYRHLRRRHWLNDQPFLYADVFIDERLARKLSQEDFTEKTALRLAPGIPGTRIADARQTLTVSTADIETAALLDMSLNAPVCHITRTAVDQHGKVVLVSNGVYRGEVVRFDLKLK